MAAQSSRVLLVSLHDVAPQHLPRLRRAEDLFRKLGIARVQYLFVPEFHGRYPAAADAEFLRWCASERPFAVDWWLHGFYHQERGGESPAATLGRHDRWRRRWLTGGEGEFLALEAGEQRRRLEAGKEIFTRCLSITPAGFVAPAWLFRPGLLRVLRDCGFTYTEDHHRLYDVTRGLTLFAPVITWATRSWWRKYGSLLVCPWLAFWFRQAPVLRVALHPHDFDHPETVANIEAVLRRLRVRPQSLPAQLDWQALALPLPGFPPDGV